MHPAFEAGDVIKEYPLPRSFGKSWLPPWRRPRRRALDGFSLVVPAGERLGLVGPNGAGKTTVARIAIGAILPDHGFVRLSGCDICRREGRKYVGLARPDDASLHPRLSVAECLRFHAALYAVSHDETPAMLERVGGLDLLERRIQTLSSGEKAKVSLAKALLHRPRLLILDEVSRVLDPGAAARLRTVLVDCASEGMAVVLITHDLAEAGLCDRVVVMQSGRVAAAGPWSDVEPRSQEVFGL